MSDFKFISNKFTKKDLVKVNETTYKRYLHNKKYSSKWIYYVVTKCFECGDNCLQGKSNIKHSNTFCSYECKFMYELKQSDPLGYSIMDQIDTNEFYYLIGFICTDGFIKSQSFSKYTRNNVSINLSPKDEGVLQQIKSFFGGTVKYKKKKGVLYPYWSLSNKKFIDYLINTVGITERKTYTLDVNNWFNTLNDNYKMSFIRGVIDGDGCVYFQENGYGHRVTIISASKLFIDMIDNYFDNNTKIRKFRVDNSTVDTYELSFLTKKTLLLSSIFSNITDIYLDRKLQKYNKIVEYYNKEC